MWRLAEDVSIRSDYGGLCFGAACNVLFGCCNVRKQMHLTREEQWSRKHELYYFLPSRCGQKQTGRPPHPTNWETATWVEQWISAGLTFDSRKRYNMIVESSWMVSVTGWSKQLSFIFVVLLLYHYFYIYYLFILAANGSLELFWTLWSGESSQCFYLEWKSGRPVCSQSRLT